MAGIVVLKPFAVSRDGHTTTNLAAGDKADVPEALVPGLVAEGFAREADPEPPPVEEPAAAVASETGLVAEGFAREADPEPPIAAEAGSEPPAEAAAGQLRLDDSAAAPAARSDRRLRR